MSAGQAAAAAGDRWAGLPADAAARLPPGWSEAEALASRLEGPRGHHVDTLDVPALLHLRAWASLARLAQRPPPGDWRVWLILAGRGFGKTRAGAEWVRGLAEANPTARIALVGATLVEARAVMVDGDSGLLAIAPPDNRPTWHATTRRLVWENGAVAQLYSAAEPESLRGPQHHHAWCDEIAKWPRGQESWRNLEMGLRLGHHPRICATTTPRPAPLIRALAAQAERGDGEIAITEGRTVDNAAHLAASFVGAMTARHAGTLVGRQELDGELVGEIEGALWSRAAIERARVPAAPATTRVVVGVDPPAGSGAHHDACGIVVVGLGLDGHGYVLADASVQGATPEGWARAVAAAARVWHADRVVVEANNGGAMIESVLRAVEPGLAIEPVHATHGKVARAEPVQALYAAGRAFHAGAFASLEDEMAGLMIGGGYEGPGRSPDRADALVWAMHALLLRPRRAEPAIRAIG